jgi:hypothetical protein
MDVSRLFVILTPGRISTSLDFAKSPRKCDERRPAKRPSAMALPRYRKVLAGIPLRKPQMARIMLYHCIMLWISLVIVASALLGGLLLLIAELRTAPEAFEDENGFQMIWRNNRPEIADVACVWELAPGIS